MKKLLPFSIAVFCFYLNSYSQYCTPSNGSGCSAGDYINNFTLHTLEKLNSGCNGDAGGFSHDTSTTTTLELGKNYNISVQSGSQYGQGFGVWIDFNGDGDFGDTLEFVYASPNYGTNVFSGTISVPDSFAVTGQTRVRVRCNYNALVYANDTCNSFSYGETEDYTITITQPPLCNEPPVVGTLESNKYVTCFYNDQITLSLSGGTDGWGQYYIGQFSTDGINWTSSPEYAKFPSEVNTSGSNYYRTYAVCGSSSDTSNVIYVEHKPIDSLTFSHTDVSCYGGADGSVSVTVFGGTPPYNYSWNYGQTAASLPNTPTLNGMNAGNYDVTVTDASGCTASGNESINEPNELQVYPYSNNANCGVSDGMAWVQVYDGTAPYTYNWSNSATTDSIFNLAAGTYFVTVTDNKGCIKSTSITVSENGAPYVSVNVTNVSCFGLSNGSAQATATSGTPPYTYLWDAAAGNQTDSTATGLAAGTYFITVTDNAGCKTIKNVVITQPSNLTVSISITHVNCFGQNSGSAYTSVSGGNYPYTYIWSNSDSTDNITSVPTGTYVVTVTDNNNCTVTDSAFINQPSQIIPSLTKQDVTCNGYCDGIVFGNATGGTPPYYYSVPQLERGDNTSINNLCAGAYEVEISDDKSCFVTDSVFINEPTILIANAGGSASVCQNASVVIGGSPAANGGTPSYTYLWTPSAGLDNQNISNPNASPDSTTYYSLQVTDSNGCYDYDSILVSVTQKPNIVINSLINVSCFSANDGQVSASFSGGISPYNYTWDDPATTSGNGSISNVYNLPPGLYHVTVTNGNGCTTIDSITITQPTQLIADAGSDKTTCSGFPTTIGGSPTASGGTPSYVYSWTPTSGLSSPSVANPDASPTVTTTYKVIVTDNNNCTDSAFVTITINAPSSEICDGIDNDCNGLVDDGISLSSNAGPDQDLCNATTTTLAATSPSDGTGMWSVITGTATISDPANPTSAVSGLIVGSSATLRWTVSGGTCTSATDDVIITVGTLATANAGTDAVICSGSVHSVSGNIGGSATSSVWTTTGSGTFNSDSSLSAIYTPSSADIASGSVSLVLTTNDPAGACPSASDSLVLTINPSPSLTLNTSNVSCNGSNNGSIVCTVSSGTAPYTFNWNTGATTTSITNLSPGAYSVTVTDNNGCNSSANASVTQPTSFVVNIGSQAVTCNGGNNGYATVSVSGGTPSYSYNWSNGATTDTITGLSDGSYIVTITDANSCTKTDSASIGTLSNLTASVSSTNVNCNGASDGTITTSASGGPTPYAYNWSNGATTANITGLSAGIYEVTVTDAYGCNVQKTDTITQPSALVVSISSTNTTCFGSSDGSASASASGGIAPYAYNWSNGSTSASANGLTAGTYNLIVTDNNGCTDSSTVTITSPTAISISPSKTDASCFGQCNGQVSVSATGGVAPYSYNWNNGGTSASISNLCAGSYSITVTDNNGCTKTTSVTINEPSALLVSATGIDASCNGAASGSAITAVSGGISPFSYNWNNGSTTQNISGLIAGTYFVTVTDSTGCSGTDSAIVNEPAPFSVNASSANASCNGTCDGSASALVSGGTSPYSYNWSSGDTGINSNGLCAGSYSVIITDDNGCSTSDTTVVLEPTALSLSVSGNNTSCNGGSDGSAAAIASGGTAPYLFNWNTGATTAAISGLSAGTYSVIVTDNNGCSDSAAVVISEPVLLTVSGSPVAVSCNGGSNGSISTNISGGTSPYSYNWNNGSTSALLNGLAAGTYSVTVTDNNGCSANTSVSVTQPPALSASATANSASCYASCNGSAAVAVAGGTSPFTYKWSNGKTSLNISGLCAGNYSVTVTDANGCSAVSSATVNQPAPINISVTTNSATCGQNNGSANAVISGGASPYKILWTTGATTTSVTGLKSGVYTINVIDNTSCSSFKQAIVNNSNGPTVTLNQLQDISCFGANDGTIDINVSGGQLPYDITWSSGQKTEDVTGLASGPYEVQIKDASGCIAAESYLVNEPAKLGVSFDNTILPTCGVADGEMSAIPAGGTAPYSYNWSNSSTDSTVTAIASGIYGLTVTDDNGCTASGINGLSDANGPGIAIDTVVAVNCGTTGAIVIDPLGNSSLSYNWTTGDTTQNISGLNPGTYGLLVTDSLGCKSTLIALVEPELPPIEPICLVTVDSTFSYNKIVWSKPAGNYIAGFNVYRESSILGLYQKIGFVPYSDLSLYNDSISDPTQKWFRYRISMLDVCGNESPLSPEHKTIYLTIDNVFPAASNYPDSISIIWDEYNGYAFSQYLIHRYKPASGWVLIDSVPAGINTYMDVNPPSVYGLQYFVEVKSPTLCTATKAAENHNSSRSNVSTITGGQVVFTVTPSVTDASEGQCDGTAAVSVSGGVSPYSYAWNTSPVQTTATATGLCTGTYNVTITDSKGDTVSTEIFIGEVGVNDLLIESSIRLYPNPNNGLFNLEFDVFGQTDIYVQIFDMHGRLVLSKTFEKINNHHKYAFDLHTIDSGVYQMKIVSGRTMAVRKVVIE